MVGEDPERVDVLLQMDVGTADDVENVQMNDAAHHYNVAPHGVTITDEFRDVPSPDAWVANGAVLGDTEVLGFGGATRDHLIADDAPVSDAVGTTVLLTTG